MKIRKQQPPDDFPRPRCTEEKFVSTHFYLVLNAQSKQANDENENGGDKAGRWTNPSDGHGELSFASITCWDIIITFPSPCVLLSV